MRDLFQQALVQQAMRRVSENANRLVLPAIVAIYDRPNGSDRATKQIGTGFCINWHERPVLVTARHTLYGHRYDEEPEDPSTKHIAFHGRLRSLSELRTREVGFLVGHDLAAVFVDELELAASLPMSCLLPTEAACRLVSIYGLLSRGFRRSRTFTPISARLRGRDARASFFPNTGTETATQARSSKRRDLSACRADPCLTPRSSSMKPCR